MLPSFQNIAELSHQPPYIKHSPNLSQFLSIGFKDYVLRRISEIPDAQSTSTVSSNDTQSEDKRYDSPSLLAEPSMEKNGAFPNYVQPVLCPCIVPIYLTAENNIQEPKIGAYTINQRQKKIRKYKLKQRKYSFTHQKSRDFKGRSFIACKKPRVNGRFVKSDCL